MGCKYARICATRINGEWRYYGMTDTEKRIRALTHKMRSLNNALQEIDQRRKEERSNDSDSAPVLH